MFERLLTGKYGTYKLGDFVQDSGLGLWPLAITGVPALYIAYALMTDNPGRTVLGDAGYRYYALRPSTCNWLAGILATITAALLASMLRRWVNKRDSETAEKLAEERRPPRLHRVEEEMLPRVPYAGSVADEAMASFAAAAESDIHDSAVLSATLLDVDRERDIWSCRVHRKSDKWKGLAFQVRIWRAGEALECRWEGLVGIAEEGDPSQYPVKESKTKHYENSREETVESRTTMSSQTRSLGGKSYTTGENVNTETWYVSIDWGQPKETIFEAWRNHPSNKEARLIYDTLKSLISQNLSEVIDQIRRDEPF